MVVENDISECNNEEVEKRGNKTRLSLFLPGEITISETNSNNDDYMKKLKLEEETWKRLYKEQKDEKEYKKKLLREITNKKLINYDLFDEEEKKYLQSGPDMSIFVKEAEELQNLVKIVNIQHKVKKEKLDTLLSDMEKACEDLTSMLSS